ncbi:ATP-dependent RecD-like DNA helicase [Spirochaetota bacterium]
MTIELEGQVENITYSNDENGFTIAKIKQESGDNAVITAVGTMPSIIAGESIIMKGEWSNHPKYGRQFKVFEFKSTVPATMTGIKKYLSSGLMNGIGEVMADRIVKKFKEKTIDILENDIKRISEVNGIGKKRADLIKKSWDAQKEIRNVMIFLQSYGIGTGYAAKIYKRYGRDSIKIVNDNPFCLATDIHGIGFKTADTIAGKLGIPREAEVRVRAGLLYVLNTASEEGSVFYPYDILVKKSMEMLKVNKDIILKSIGELFYEKNIIIEDLNEDVADFKENNKAVFLPFYHTCEKSIAKRLHAIARSPSSLPSIDTGNAVNRMESKLSIELADRQREAVQTACTNKVMIITGCPGTGKSTIINAIINIFSPLNVRISLAAPTGRAAQRMIEATGMQAKTIHRLLEYSLAKGGFQRNSSMQLECDLLIIDEASMIDTLLMNNLMKAVQNRTHIIFVGDVNQLPAVGAGNVLNDLIRSGLFPVTTLTEIFRQARNSSIIMNAYMINSGTIPDLASAKKELDDFYFIEKEEPTEILSIIKRLIMERIPKKFRLDPVDDIQVLSPMYKGLIGADNLNRELQAMLNPSLIVLVRGEKIFKLCDKVMQVRNNYTKDVFNGDIGRIIMIDTELKQATISFDGRPVQYEYTELDELMLAYAITVHKSQGSEYPAVIIPLTMGHYMLLQRNLIYTAITRGKKLVVILGTKQAFVMGIRNNKTERRYTSLCEKLKTMNVN